MKKTTTATEKTVDAPPIPVIEVMDVAPIAAKMNSVEDRVRELESIVSVMSLSVLMLSVAMLLFMREKGEPLELPK